MSKHTEKAAAVESCIASVIRGAVQSEEANARGFYPCVCTGPVEERRAEYVVIAAQIALAVDQGDETSAETLRAKLREIPVEEKWRDVAVNVVTTEGKNKALDVHLRAQTQITSWYIGLISSVSYSAVAAADVAAQINGTNSWKEAGPTNAPNYTGNRQALTVGNAASAGSLASSAVSAFPITATGTVKGCFLVSTNTKDGTTGTLYSAGLFSGGDKVVGNGDTLNVSYTASL